jgi:hypothetical protein
MRTTGIFTTFAIAIALSILSFNPLPLLLLAIVGGTFAVQRKEPEPRKKEKDFVRKAA